MAQVRRDRQAGKVLRTLKGHTGMVWSVVLHTDGRQAATAFGDHTLKVWDTKTEEDERTFVPDIPRWSRREYVHVP